MKNLMFSCAVCCAVLSLLSSAAASTFLVNTTFEPNSAGPGTWNLSTGDAWDEPDIATDINWAPEGPDSAFKSGTCPEGEQFGHVNTYVPGEGSINSNVIKLRWSDGGNTGVYTATWYQKLRCDDPNWQKQSITAFLDETGEWDTHIALVSFVYGAWDKGYTNDIFASSTWDTRVPLITDANSDVWYEFEVVIDMPNQEVDFRGKQAGAANWEGEVLDQSFYDDSADSLDLMYCLLNNNDLADSSWDGIQITPEPATMVFLALGSAFILRRKRA